MKASSEAASMAADEKQQVFAMSQKQYRKLDS
jgi:hypothetical protein